MPQFDFVHVSVPQLAWLAVFFAILYFAIVLPTLPKLGRVMEARENQVMSDIDTAAAAKAEADRIGADYDAGIASAHDEARRRIETARGAAAQSLETVLAKSKAALDARLAGAEASLASARGAALAEIETVAADAAADIVEKLTGRRPASADTAAATRAALG